MNKHVRFTTLGCKVNQAESEALASFAAENGHASGVCVVNTCAVTTKAAMQSRQAIRKAVKTYPGETIVVTGCLAQTQPEAVSAIRGVDYVIGQAGKHRIFEIVDAHSSRKNFPPVVMNESVREKRPFTPMPAVSSGARTRPFLKIQDGCDAFCSYCIVPYSRGRSRSLSPGRVIAELDELIRKGAREVVLTGIHLGRWGTDLPGGNTLFRLLEKIRKRPGLGRLRLSSLEPLEIDGLLLDLIKEDPRICRHFHVPLQSGDPGILQKMNRRYSHEDFEETITRIKKRLPDAAVGVDVMAGFPGETKEAFENTLSLTEKLPISYLHVFPFSPRPPAPAAQYPEPVSAETTKKRCRALAELGKLKKWNFYRQMTGRTLEVIVETPSKRSGFSFKGLSSNYIPVYIHPTADTAPGRIADCRITSAYRDHFVSGEIHESRGCKNGLQNGPPEETRIAGIGSENEKNE